jgi:hypothetical protein
MGATQQWSRVRSTGSRQRRQDAYDAEYLTKAQAERIAFENLRKLRHRVEGLNWSQVIDKPGVAEKLKDLLDAIEVK